MKNTYYYFKELLDILNSIIIEEYPDDFYTFEKNDEHNFLIYHKFRNGKYEKIYISGSFYHLMRYIQRKIRGDL